MRAEVLHLVLIQQTELLDGRAADFRNTEPNLICDMFFGKVKKCTFTKPINHLKRRGGKCEPQYNVRNPENKEEFEKEILRRNRDKARRNALQKKLTRDPVNPVGTLQI